MTLEQLDNTLLELIRLQVVSGGYLPDITQYSTVADYKAAKEALKQAGGDEFKLIDLQNVSSGESRDGKLMNCIIINRAEEPTGQLGAAGIRVFEEYDDNGTTKFKKHELPSRSQNVLYEIVYICDTRKYDSIIDKIIRNALKSRAHFRIFDEVNGFVGEVFYMEREQKIDLSNGELIEKQIRYMVEDIWLEDTTEIESGIVQITEITTELEVVDSKVVFGDLFDKDGQSITWATSDPLATDVSYYKVYNVSADQEEGIKVFANDTGGYNSADAGVTITAGATYRIRAYNDTDLLIKTSADDGLDDISYPVI